jgi:hypothetical protein
MNLIKRILYWIILGSITLIIGVGLAVYLFKDRIIQQVIAEVNQLLTTPVQVEKIDIDFLHGFPNVAVRFYQVYMGSGFGETLLDAEQVYVLVSPFDLANGNFDIAKIEIIGAKIFLKIDNQGNTNFDVFRNPDTVKVDRGNTDFNLRSILLENVELDYDDAITHAHYNLNFNKLVGNINEESGRLKNKLSGAVKVSEIKFSDYAFSLRDPIKFSIQMILESETQKLSIEKSTFTTENTELELSGNVDLSDSKHINLKVSAENATIQLIASLLPAKYSSYLREYHSKGKINLSAEFKGDLDGERMPSLISKFSLEAVELKHPELNADVKALNLSGFLHIKDISKLETGELVVDQAEGLLMGNSFTCHLGIVNLQEPQVKFDFKGSLDVEWLTQTLRYQRSGSAKGSLDVDLEYNANFVKDAAKRQEALRGRLVLNGVDIDLPNGTPLSSLVGELSFNRGQITASNLSGFLGKSDVLLNGKVSGLQRLSQVTNNQETIHISADLKSAYIDLDEITATILELSQDSIEIESKQSPPVDFSLNFIIKKLTFKRFYGKEIVGELSYADNQLKVSHFGSKTMGGKVVVSGLLAQKPSGDYFIDAYAKTNDIFIDSLFYVFHNFNQKFITDKYLKGQLNSETFTSMYFDSGWRLRRNLLRAETRLNVVNGELNNFAPIMALSKYLDDREDKLDQLRFANLTNYINIASDTVFIPEMTVKTNVRDIKVAGTHTLSQHIDYRLSVPVINENIDRDEAFGAVERVQDSSPNLLFRIKGTTTDYRVNYDLVRAVGKVFQLLDLKKTFQQKEQTLDSVALEEEVFDW